MEYEGLTELERQRLKAINFIEFLPVYEKLEPIIGKIELDDNIYSRAFISKILGYKIQEQILSLCKEYKIETELQSLEWFAFSIGDSKIEKGIDSFKILVYKHLKNLMLERSIVERYYKDPAKIKLTISDNYDNKFAATDSELIANIIKIIDKYSLPLSEEDIDFVKTHKKPGRRVISKSRDRTAYYLNSYLKEYCSSMTPTARDIFIYCFMEIIGFPYESKADSTKINKYDAVRQAINRYIKSNNLQKI